MRQKVAKFQKIIIKDKLSTFNFIFLIVSVLVIKELNLLFYNTLDSPDFNKYIVYLQHFFDGQITNKEHGLMYYYIHSLNYSIFYSDLNNFEFFIHRSIQNVNFYIYIIGLIGYYFLLQYLEFSNKTIFATFIFINFFPPSISMRLVFKPEILAFALLPWIILALEKFLKSKNIKYLFFAIPLLISALTIKGNVLVIISIYLLISYFKIFIVCPKKGLFLIIVLSLVGFALMTMENNKVNGKSILDIQSGSTIEENYNFKAPPSIIYKIDMFRMLSSPIKHNHAKSFLGITLLETTGDYFDLYWDNDASAYFENRKELISYEQSNEIKSPKYDEKKSSITIFQQRMTDVYLYETIGLVISLFLFYFLLTYTKKHKNFRKYLIAIFIGMLVLLFHSITGIPKNNFDPLVGDTFKPLYYSFVFIFSFAFLIAIMLKERKFRQFYIVLYCFVIFFILGFPKNSDFVPKTHMLQSIQTSVYCPVEKLIYLDGTDFEDMNCSKSISFNDDSELSMYRNKLEHKPVNLFFLILNFISMACLTKNKKLFKNS